VEKLREKEEMVHICEPETGKSLSDDEEKRSVKDIINHEEDKSELSSL